MQDLSQVLVPIDFSRGSKAAISMAQTVAESYGVPCHFAHVIPPHIGYFSRVLFPYAGMGDDRDAILSELRVHARDDLIDLHRLGELVEGNEPAHKLSVVPTHAKDALAQSLNALRADSPAGLTVVGRSGDAGARPGYIGSVLQKVLLNATHPVLVADTSGVARVKRIAVGLDLGHCDQQVLETALLFAGQTGADLTLVTVVPTTKSFDVGGILDKASRTGSGKLANAGKTELKKHLTRIQDKVSVPFSLQRDKEPQQQILVGDPIAELGAFCQDKEIDVLIVGSRGAGIRPTSRGLGRTVNGLLNQMTTHTLVVPTRRGGKRARF